MSTQVSLNFSGRLTPAAQEGIATAIDHADKRWLAAAKACVFLVAQQHAEITVDHVYLAMQQANARRISCGMNPFSTHNMSAISGVMLACSKDPAPWLKWTPKMVRTKLDQSIKHGNVRRVWQSTLYAASEA
jgi:hypothetical protein